MRSHRASVPQQLGDGRASFKHFVASGLMGDAGATSERSVDVVYATEQTKKGAEENTDTLVEASMA